MKLSPVLLISSLIHQATHALQQQKQQVLYDSSQHTGEHDTQNLINLEKEKERRLQIPNFSETLTLTITNQAFNQPFSPFFVMVHNSDAQSLYVRGEEASSELAILAEDGDPSSLVEYYTSNNGGVGSVTSFSEGVPYFGGDTLQIEVEVSLEYPLVTIATMAINTNDCFVSLNGAYLYGGQVLDLPGLDAGSEENNEDCGSIPGPACANIDENNESSGNGEGFVHVHRGFQGVGDLAANRYDWRNPMMRVSVESDGGGRVGFFGFIFLLIFRLLSFVRSLLDRVIPV